MPLPAKKERHVNKLVWLILGVLLLPLVAAAQDLSETYTAPDSSLAFDYPAGWSVDDSRVTIGLASPDGLQIAILNPGAASRVGEKLTAVETLDLLLNFTQYPPSEITTVMVGGVEVARATYRQGGEREGLAAVVRYATTETGVVVGVAPAEQLAELESIVLAVAASLRRGDSPAEATPEVTEIAAAPLPAGVLFQDDFESGLRDVWAAERGEPAVIQDGDNAVLEVEGDDSLYLTSGVDWTDYAAEMRIKVIQPSGIDGLIGVRFDPQAVTTYGAYFDDDRIGLAYFYGHNDMKLLSSSRVSLVAGQWYTVRLQVKGSMMELYFNNRRINWLTSTQFDRGTLTLYAAPGSAFYVDDVVIRDLRDG